MSTSMSPGLPPRNPSSRRPARVALIKVQVAGKTAQAVFRQVGGPGNPVDTMTTWVALRNNKRY